jgi:DedD protein
LSTPFQNRLVGTIIISAAAIIFLPDILDGEKHSQQTSFDVIAKAPVFQGDKELKSFPTAQMSQLPQPVIEDESAEDEQLEAYSAMNTDADVLVNAVAPAPEFNSLEDVPNPQTIEQNAQPNLQQNTMSNTDLANGPAWVLQLGSFKHQKNVDVLLQTLKDNGYVAFTRPIKTHSGTLTKVFVGPELSKSRLEHNIVALKTLTGMQGKITSFKPVN